MPEFRPGDPDAPFLPGFDISIDRLTIDNLTLAAGIAGPRAQRVDLDGEVQVTDRRLKVTSRGAFGRTDRYAFRIDGRTWRVPDGAVAVDDGFGGKSAYVTVRGASATDSHDPGEE